MQKTNLIGIAGEINSGKDLTGKIIQGLVSREKAILADSLHAQDPRKHQLYEEYDANNSGWQIKKFAAKLKQIASILTGVPLDWWEVADFKREFMDRVWWPLIPEEELIMPKSDVYVFADGTKHYSRTYRQFLQLLGTDAVRDIISPETWVNALFADYNPVNQSAPGRFTTEPVGYPSVDFQHIEALDGPIERWLTYPNWVITDVRFPNELQAIYDRGGVCINLTRPVKREHNFPGQPHLSETALANAKFTYVIDNCGTIEELSDKVKAVLQDLKLID